MNKQTYDLRKAAGICVRCGKNKAEENRVMCAECLEKERLRMRENRKALKNMGFCPRCGENRLFGDEKLCLDCREKMYRYNKRHKGTCDKNYIKIRKESGVCIKCGKRPPVPGKTKCSLCASKERIRARDYRIRKGIMVDRSEQPGYGECYFCGRSVVLGMKVCADCLKKCMSNLPDNGGKNDYWRNENKLVLGKRG